MIILVHFQILIMLSRKILIKKFEQIKKERKFINNFWIIIASLNINKFFNKNYFTKILVKSKFINKLNSFYS